MRLILNIRPLLHTGWGGGCCRGHEAESAEEAEEVGVICVVLRRLGKRGRKRGKRKEGRGEWIEWEGKLGVAVIVVAMKLSRRMEAEEVGVDCVVLSRLGKRGEEHGLNGTGYCG